MLATAAGPIHDQDTTLPSLLHDEMAAFGRQAMPPELVDYMLDEIISEYATISDRRDLKNCSLVCKSWLPRSSVHLLRTIEVRTLQLEQYLAFARTSARLRAHVRRFIIQGTIDVTTYLDEILVTMPGLIFMEQWNNLTLEFARPPDFAVEDAEEIIVTRHYVEPPAGVTVARDASLSIDHLKLSCMPLVSFALSIRPFRRIGTLELRSVQQYLRHNLAGGREYGRLLPLRPPPEVTTLIIDGCLTNDLAFLLAAIPIRPTALCVKQFTHYCWSGLSFLLTHTGHNLDKLTLWPKGEFYRLRPGDPGFDSPREEPLASTRTCQSLRTLDIIPEESNAHFCGHILWRLPCKTLRRICIKLEEHQLWETLASVRLSLEQRHNDFANLETVELIGLGGGRPMAADRLQDLQRRADDVFTGALRGKIRLSS